MVYRYIYVSETRQLTVKCALLIVILASQIIIITDAQAHIVIHIQHTSTGYTASSADDMTWRRAVSCHCGTACKH